MKVKTLSVNCPSCNKQVLMTPDNPYRPFCSERCKTIDFADWATESHRIPGPNIFEGEELDDLWSDDLNRQD